MADLRRHLPSLAFALVGALVAAGFAGAFIYTGWYDIGADAPHSRLVSWTLETLRDRAIAHHARDVIAPADLSDPNRIATRAGLYAELCSGCHLPPARERTEI